MIAIQIIDIGTFMTKLLRSDLFDSFLFLEGCIQNNITYTFDGHLNSDFYSEEELATEGLQNLTYLPFAKLRPILFDLIKGKRTPGYLKLVLQLSSAETEEILNSLGNHFSTLDIHGLIFHLTFQNKKLTCTTGVSYCNFSMDKSLENEWDSYFYSFFKSHSIPFSEFS